MNCLTVLLGALLYVLIYFAFDRPMMQAEAFALIPVIVVSVIDLAELVGERQLFALWFKKVVGTWDVD